MHLGQYYDRRAHRRGHHVPNGLRQGSRQAYRGLRIKNTGQLPKYYVHNYHPAIIDRVTFQKVQKEIARRVGKRKTSSKAKTELGKYSGKYALSELMTCGSLSFQAV